MLKFDCPHCGQHIECEDAMCGSKVQCPVCKDDIIIPTKPKPEAKVATLSFSNTPTFQGDEDSEKDIFNLKPSAKAFLGQIIWGIILLPFIIGIFLLLNVWIKRVSLRYRLTNQRLFIQRGLIAKHIEEIELFRVKDAIVYQSILQRILGFGKITVLTTDDSTPKIEMIGISNPINVKETLRTYYRASRKREKVHVAEFIPS